MKDQEFNERVRKVINRQRHLPGLTDNGLGDIEATLYQTRERNKEEAEEDLKKLEKGTDKMERDK